MKPSRISRPFFRRGPDYRMGEDRSFAEVRVQFALAGVKVGAWVSSEEQQLAANLVFDALADLAWVMKVPPELLGLRGNLQLAFGTRGQRNVQAHYEPATRILALAKNAGAGALAHEFWHAFDHHIARHLYPDAGPRELASHLWLTERRQHPHPLNQKLSALLQTVLLSRDAMEPSDYVRRAIALDEQRSSLYFSQPTELLARAFESWVQDSAEITNHYLVSGTQKSTAAKQGAFPEGEHRRRCAIAFADYFSALGAALSGG
ncbi:MAG: CLCA_X family protein [Pseudomonadota bacterium]|uniref:CLCA_X family protein n=1 Tax=Gallaecimonas pentaromativorans TaxID=584787 RepID=UPI00067F4FF8|nr:CLCA_X family protein [Gallaecimonas pentaromativorans]MED5523884.1 CLCA_X family protein [Pseudomonadota bacterium]